MKDIQNKIYEACKGFIADAEGKPSKAAHKRMRKATLEIAKLGREFRRLSILEDAK